MMLTKSKYYNGHQTCCSLMIDDLVPMYVSYNGDLKPWNDWGYGKKDKHSLFEYLDKYFFQKFPEVKGTFFIPFESQHNMPKDSGMKIVTSEFDKTYMPFFKEFEDRFDIAFHGIRHTWFDDNSFKGKVNFEFSTLQLADANDLKEKIRAFEQLYDIKISGGKFPGYHRKNQHSFDLLKELGMNWWAFSLADNTIGNNDFGLIKTKKGDIIDVPSNINGNAYNTYPNSKPQSFKNKLRNVKNFLEKQRIQNYLDHLYSNRLPITIQEHAQNQSLNGKRQRPNLFDDLASLEKLFTILRNADIWYATCSEIAMYQDSYINTELVEKDNEIQIHYKGNYGKLLLSFESDRQRIEEVSTGKIIEGVARNGKFIFNELTSGSYR